MRVYLATDHAGFALKEQIKVFLQENGYEVVDCGAFSYDPDDDYPDFVAKAAIGVASEPPSSAAKGIVLGKSGAGECIVANKIKGIRAALGFSKENVELMRAHNDANVLSLGSGFVNTEQAKELVMVFLETPFANEERHRRRIDRISELEGARDQRNYGQ